MDGSGLLEGRTAVVTGAARGQGAAEARALAAEGALVLVTDVRDELGEAVAAELGERGRYLHLDVAEEADWEQAVHTAVDTFGPVRVLVNNAGILRHSAIVDTTREAFDETMAVNVTGCFLGMRAVASSMNDAGGGSIVNTSSTGGMTGPKGAIAYVTSKWAVRGMTKSAANEFAKYGIRVNSIHPGPILTAMIAGDDFDADEFVSRNRQNLAIRRMGTVDDIAAAVVYLASDNSSYVTGAELAVDGGWTIGN